jgi:hypothetical protein
VTRPLQFAGSAMLASRSVCRRGPRNGSQLAERRRALLKVRTVAFLWPHVATPAAGSTEARSCSPCATLAPARERRGSHSRRALALVLPRPPNDHDRQVQGHLEATEGGSGYRPRHLRSPWRLVSGPNHSSKRW